MLNFCGFLLNMTIANFSINRWSRKNIGLGVQMAPGSNLRPAVGSQASYSGSLSPDILTSKIMFISTSDSK